MIDLHVRIAPVLPLLKIHKGGWLPVVFCQDAECWCHDDPENLEILGNALVLHALDDTHAEAVRSGIMPMPTLPLYPTEKGGSL